MITTNPHVSSIQGLTETDIANYLAHHPVFFERHTDLLLSLRLTSPHGQRAVSLQERQLEILRDKIKGLEQQIIDMIRHGQENMGLAQKLHRWTRGLMLTTDLLELPYMLTQELIHEFLIPEAALRIWEVDEPFMDEPFSQEVSADVRSFASSLIVPYCGLNSGFEAALWFEEPGRVASVAFIPLRHDGSPVAFGMLALGSPDPTRFTSEMSTEFLVRVGELSSAALSRLLPED